VDVHYSWQNLAVNSLHYNFSGGFKADKFLAVNSAIGGN